MRTRNLADVRSDSDLAVQAAAGSTPAFEELYRRHAPAAWGLACAVTGGAEHAADAVADAFVGVFRALPAGRPENPAAFRTSLMAATLGAAIDHLRRRDRVEVPGAIAHPGRRAPNPATDRLAAAFGALPERWRTVLWLTEVEGMAPEAAAAVVGSTAATTARLAMRARAGLRERMAAPGEWADLPTALRATAPAAPAALAGAVTARWKLASAAGPAAAAVAGGSASPGLRGKLQKPLLATSTGLFALGIIAASVVSGPDSSPGRALPTRSVPPAVTTQPAQVAPQQTIRLAAAEGPPTATFDSGLRDLLAPAVSAVPAAAPAATAAGPATIEEPAGPGEAAPPIFDSAPGSEPATDAPAAPPPALSDALIGAGLGVGIGGQDVGLTVDLGPTPGIGVTLGPLALGEATPAVPGSALGVAVDLSSVLLPAALPSGLASGQ